MLPTLLLAFTFLGQIGHASPSQVSPASNQQSSLSNGAAQNDADVPVFRMTAREVLVDVIALQGRDQPVLDLRPEDLQVSEDSIPTETYATGHRQRSRTVAEAERGTITSLHVIEPNASQTQGKDGWGGLQITASCLERSTVHYQLAFHPGPDGWRSGYHRVLISTTRRGVKLYYRHTYYVGLTEPLAKPLAMKSDAVEKLLLQASCYYPATPPSISMQARLIDTGRSDVLRYSVAVDAGSLSFLTLDNGAARPNAGIDRRVELDYGVCTFDGRGQPINFFQAQVEKVLSSAEYARALDRGFPHLLQFPTPAHIAMTRVIVRDRQTGNLGAIDVPYSGPADTSSAEASPANDAANLATATQADLEAAENPQSVLTPDPWVYRGPSPPLNAPVLDGPVGSFGSIISKPQSLCGDVYELPQQTPNLPDFRGLDPIGSLYTSFLDVPNQEFSNTTGIPGVTPRTNLFGIDYHGVLWVTKAGKYEFQMISDDGAIFRIDDKQVIDLDGLHSARAAKGGILLEAGRHTVEVRYYQGACCAVALVLWVKSPGARAWTLFDMNDYLPPASHAGSLNR